MPVEFDFLIILPMYRLKIFNTMDKPNKTPVIKSKVLLAGKYLLRIIPVASEIMPTGNETD